MQKRQRFSQRTTSIAGTPYLEIMAYDTLGRPASQRDAAGYTLTSHYSTAGYVQSLSDSRVNGTVYEILSVDARGQTLQDRESSKSFGRRPSEHGKRPVCAGLFQNIGNPDRIIPAAR